MIREAEKHTLLVINCAFRNDRHCEKNRFVMFVVGFHAALTEYMTYASENAATKAYPETLSHNQHNVVGFS